VQTEKCLQKTLPITHATSAAWLAVFSHLQHCANLPSVTTNFLSSQSSQHNVAEELTNARCFLYWCCHLSGQVELPVQHVKDQCSQGNGTCIYRVSQFVRVEEINNPTRPIVTSPWCSHSDGECCHCCRPIHSVGVSRNHCIMSADYHVIRPASPTSFLRRCPSCSLSLVPSLSSLPELSQDRTWSKTTAQHINWLFFVMSFQTYYVEKSSNLVFTTTMWTYIKQLDYSNYAFMAGSWTGQENGTTIK